MEARDVMVARQRLLECRSITNILVPCIKSIEVIRVHFASRQGRKQMRARWRGQDEEDDSVGRAWQEME
jgi:hypothetical protein